MTKLYLLRHGQSEWNILNKVQGQEDINLTDKGIEQAKKAADRLYNEEIDLIYTSDLKRAYETAKIVGSRLNLDINKVEGLREINFGIWQGLKLDEIKKDYESEYSLWRKEPHKLNLETAEKLSELQDRMLKTTNELIMRNPNRNILLVSHGTAIKALILGILDIDISKYNKITIGNVGLSIIEFREFSPVIKVLNDTNHVRED